MGNLLLSTFLTSNKKVLTMLVLRKPLLMLTMCVSLCVTASAMRTMFSSCRDKFRQSRKKSSLLGELELQVSAALKVRTGRPAKWMKERMIHFLDKDLDFTNTTFHQKTLSELFQFLKGFLNSNDNFSEEMFSEVTKFVQN